MSDQVTKMKHLNRKLVGSNLTRNRGLVLFSGGQDSTTCIAWALGRYREVVTVGFDYGQNHSVELACRKEILRALEADFDWPGSLGDDYLVDLSFIGALGTSSLTSSAPITRSKSGLPSTFVPGRNLFFVTAAASLAYQLDISEIIIGACDTDYSGYPDCRRNTLTSLEKTISLGMDVSFRLLAPLMNLDKREIWQLASNIGGEAFIHLIQEKTHSCYMGDRTIKHEWGYGCANCAACTLRSKGFESFVSELRHCQRDRVRE